MKKIIAILEDNEGRTKAMRVALADAVPDATPVFFNSAKTMIEWLEGHITSVSLLSLDHDLDFLPGSEGQLIDPGDGRDVARFLAGQKPRCPAIVHTSNAFGASSMMLAMKDAGWKVERVLPEPDLGWIGQRWIATVLRLLRGDGRLGAQKHLAPRRG